MANMHLNVEQAAQYSEDDLMRIGASFREFGSRLSWERPAMTADCSHEFGLAGDCVKRHAVTRIVVPIDFAEQLRRFNAERERLLQGRPISGDRRIPGPYSGVGGDVEEPQR